MIRDRFAKPRRQRMKPSKINLTMTQAETLLAQDAVVAAAALESRRVPARSSISYCSDRQAESSETTLLGTCFGDKLRVFRGVSGLFEKGWGGQKKQLCCRESGS